MNWVGVLPYVHKPYFDECRKSMHPSFFKNVLCIDNTTENIGIMKSHNKGVEMMEGADWLVVMSAAIRFGESGGRDFIDRLKENPDHHVLHGVGPKRDPLGRVVPYGWHLVAFNKTVFEAIGKWDENFTPYSLDDIDMSLRIQKHFGKEVKWDKVPCDVSDTTSAHSINLGGVTATYEPRNRYFERKWGRDGGEWDKPAYDHPFNDESKPLSWWPKPDDPLSIDKVEFKNGRDY